MDGDAQYMDELDYYNYGREFDRMSKGSGGHAKHKGKKENLKFAPSGNVRKIVANVQNAEKKEKQARQRVNSVWSSATVLLPHTELLPKHIVKKAIHENSPKKSLAHLILIFVPYCD